MSQAISVVIPLFNHVSYIRQAIDSVLLQGNIVREIIVIDDGSSDGSVVLAREAAAADSRIVAWSQPNQGAHRTINTGLMRAVGKYVTILNSDDVFAPGRLVRLVAALELDRQAGIAGSSIEFIDAAGAAIANPWHAAALATFKASGQLGPSLMDANFLMTTSNIVMRRNLIEQIGLFAPLRYAHDLDFLLRAAASGTRLAFVDAPLLQYRIHATNTIKEGDARVKREWAVACAHHLHLLRRAPDFAEDGWQTVGEIMEMLARHTLERAVQACLFYFDRHPTDTLEHSAILSDRDFAPLLAKTLS